MGGFGKYIDRPGGKGADANVVGRRQDFLVNATRDYDDVDMAEVAAKAEMLAGAYASGSPKMLDAISDMIASAASGGSAKEFEIARRGLEMIDAQSPGAAARLVAAAGSPESLAMDFPMPAGAEPPSAAPEVTAAQPRTRTKKTLAEELSLPRTWGSGEYLTDADGNPILGADGEPKQGKGFGELIKEEVRSKADRAASTSANPNHRAMLDAWMANSDLYLVRINYQNDQLRKMGMPDDQIRRLSREQRDTLVPIEANELPEEYLRRANANRSSRLAKKGGEMQDVYFNLSPRDGKLIRMLQHAEKGTAPILDEEFRGWRLQFPVSQGGEIVRPGLAPSGEFLARLHEHAMGGPDVHPGYVAKMTPVFDRAVRQQYMTAPATENYRGIGGRTASDFAQMLLEPFRGGVHQKRAEAEGYPFPIFADGDLKMNRGPREVTHITGPAEPGPIASSLLDGGEASSLPVMPISTPEAAPEMLPTEPPVTPADNELGMHDPRLNLLAALLA